MSISDLVKDAPDRWKSFKSSAYLYGVDLSSGFLYYTLTYGAQELATGNEPEQIAKYRMIGAVTHALVMRYMGKRRDRIAQKRNVTKASPVVDKARVSLEAIVPIQAAVYAGMLTAGMAISGKWDLKSAAAAWAVGVFLATPHSIIYGYFQDAWRTLCGVKPAVATVPSARKYQSDLAC